MQHFLFRLTMLDNEIFYVIFNPFVPPRSHVSSFSVSKVPLSVRKAAGWRRLRPSVDPSRSGCGRFFAFQHFSYAAQFFNLPLIFPPPSTSLPRNGMNFLVRILLYFNAHMKLQQPCTAVHMLTFARDFCGFRLSEGLNVCANLFMVSMPPVALKVCMAEAEKWEDRGSASPTAPPVV